MSENKGKHLWGMVIDLNKCTGCGACITACKSENNLPTVSPDEATKGRVNDWIRVKTVEEGEYPNIKTRYMPLLCNHCDNPPCTKVCPVRATYKNDEGIVAQVYPRCIGCRYCTVACPYSVKVFNWYAPEFPEEYTKTLNPDVSVRLKGVVEKCTFCHHRLQKAKEQATLEKREIKEEDYQPACVQVCPPKAMTFGDLGNKKSEVAKLAAGTNTMRLLEELGTEPKVIYILEKDKT